VGSLKRITTAFLSSLASTAPFTLLQALPSTPLSACLYVIQH
jgi:hypothetical protein